MKDYYYILGVDASCSPADLEEAYVKLSDRFKPDPATTDAFFAKRYTEIREAYEVLSSPVRRSWYDEERGASKPLAKERQRAKQYHSNTKGVNMVLTGVLSVLALLLGYYIYKAMHTTKPIVRQMQATIIEPPVHKPKRHKRRVKKNFAYHPIQQKPVSATFKSKVATNRNPPATVPKVADDAPVIAKAISVPTQIVAPPAPQTYTVAKPVSAEKSRVADSQPGSDAGNDYLYSTYLKANQTGVIRLREDASYNAEVITSVPTNTRVFVLERGPLYYKVKADNTVGYVPKWTVQEK